MNQKVKNAFSCVKQDINELKGIQSSSFQAMKERFESTARELTKIIEDSMAGCQKDSKNASMESLKRIEALKTDLESISGEFSKRIKDIEGLRTEVVRSGKMITKFDIQLARFQRSLDLMSSKLNEFDNMSVDVDEVEKTFIRKDDVKDYLKRTKTSEQTLTKLQNKVKKLYEGMLDIEEEKHEFARSVDMRGLEDDIIELKSRLALKNDIEALTMRIDSIETKIFSRADKTEKAFKTLETSISDVYSLKRSFVTKEQFKIQRKEIKMLIQGLKDIQKIKNKLKNKTGQKRLLNRLTDFFFEDD